MAKQVLGIPLVNCDECGVWETCHHAFMQPEIHGDIDNMDVLFIGEAPGRDEDEQGKPFIGKAGSIFRQVTEPLGLENYGVTNSAICRPPGNKMTTEIHKACRPNTLRLIMKLKPKGIVVLGKWALQAVMGGGYSIGGVRGEPMKWPHSTPGYSPWILGTWHPASIFYTFGAKRLRMVGDNSGQAASMQELKYREIYNDIQLVTMLQKEPRETPKQHLVDTPDRLVEALQLCRQADELAMDIETGSGDDLGAKNPYKGAEVIGVSVSYNSRGEAFYIPMAGACMDVVRYTKEQATTVIRKILLTDAPKIFQNAAFDIPFLEYMCSVRMKNFSFDTMIAQHTLDETAKRSLKYMASLYFGWYGYASELQNWLKENKIKPSKRGYYDVPASVLIPYACLDASATMLLKPILDQELKEENLHDLFHDHVVKVIRCLIDVRANGVKLDFDLMKDTEEYYREQMVIHMEEIRACKEVVLLERERLAHRVGSRKTFWKRLVKWVVDDLKQEIPDGIIPDDWDEKEQLKINDTRLDYLWDLWCEHREKVPCLKDIDFSPTSPKQVTRLVYELAGAPVRYETDSKAPSTNQVAMAEAAREGFEVARPIMQYRVFADLLGTNVVGFRALLGDDKLLHTEFLVTTKTGRLRSRQPNLQNIPWDKRIRGMFHSRFPDGVVLSGDYAQVELRVAAGLAKQENMTQWFKDGEDVHRWSARMIYKRDDISDALRRYVKTANFGVLYGCGPELLARDYGMDMDEARTILERWREEFPDIWAWMEDMKKFGREYGYVENPFGRKRRLPGINSRNRKERSFWERRAVNSPIQGGAADITTEAMWRVEQKIKELGWQSKMIMQVHDQVMFDCYSMEESEELQDQMTPIFQRDYDFMNGVPLLFEWKVGKSWGSFTDTHVGMRHREELESMVDEGVV